MNGSVECVEKKTEIVNVCMWSENMLL
jgi:hypothetical protein